MRASRLSAALAGAALAVGLLPVAATAATSTDAVCPPPGKTSSNQFPDDDGSVHEANIDCMAQYGIAQGTGNGQYSPGRTVTRAQMATFIANLVRTSGKDLPSGSDAFSDDDGNVHEDDINALAGAGIVKGTGSGTYSPGAPVSRAAMATFIANALSYVTGSDLPAGSDAFTDDDGNVHEGNINALAGQDVVSGTGGTTYSPANPVTRAQMASFVMQGAAYLDQQGAWGPTQSGAPTLTNLVPTDAGLVNVLDNGDQVLMVFDEAVSAADGAGLQVSDTLGAITSLLGGGNTTITQPNPNEVLFTVTSLASTVPGPVTLDGLSGVTDADGNPADLASWAGSTIIDAATGGGSGGGSVTDTIPPTITSIVPTDTAVTGILDNGDTVLVTFSEAVDAATASLNVSGGLLGTVTSLLDSGNTTITQPQPNQVLFTVSSLLSTLSGPVTLDGLSGITDTAGNPADLGTFAGTTLIS